MTIVTSIEFNRKYFEWGKMFFTKGRNCGDYRDKTCCDFVTIGTKHFLTNVKSIESHRIEYE